MISTRFNPIGKNFGSTGTSFEVTTTDNNTTFSFASARRGRTLATDSSSYSIDWGDGTIDTYTDVSTVPSHNYITAGKYIVTISDDLREYAGYYGKAINTNTLVTRAISWGSKLENVSYFYRDCSNLTGPIPEWNDTITNVDSCYSHCSSLTSSIPAWNDVITNASSCYYSCRGLTGSIPKWNNTITDANNCYNFCTSLTGSIPAWNNTITNASWCYYACSNLTGPIPEWNDTIWDASWCYGACRNLTGIWDENATDEEIMPSHITSYSNCVLSTPDELRAYFYESWGGTKVA